MSFANDLKSEVSKIFSENWKRREGRVVPFAENVQLGNDAVELNGTVLYTDLVDSSGLVTRFHDWFAADVYKAFLSCACRIIREEGGEITAFDGDRVMAVFLGDHQQTNAVRTALMINWARNNIIQPEIKKKSDKLELRHVTGIDCGKLFVARVGIKGFNDLVWVGKAANHAANLSAVRHNGYPTIISGTVYHALQQAAKVGGQPSRSMWERLTPSGIAEETYGGNWTWTIT